MTCVLNPRIVRGLLRSLWMYYADPRQLVRMRALYSQFMREGDLAFDIGAHVGSRKLAYWSLGARVVAVEPVPGAMRVMRALYGRSSRIHLIEAAVSSAPGLSKMLVCEREPTVSTLSAEWADRMLHERTAFASTAWEQSVSVRMLTIDELVEQFGEPAFCKIDVEGHDREVLNGVTRPLRALSFEFVPPALDLALECLECVSRLGSYEFNWSRGDSMQLHWPAWVDAQTLARHLELYPRQGNPGDVYARLTDRNACHTQACGMQR